MAISKSFFGLRRGSTKDHTFSTYRGKQVTKSRVAHVANPQSQYQMRQRLKLVMVANTATKLKGLVDHSFEGVNYGQDSIGKFRSMNLAEGVTDVLSYVMKGVGDSGVANYIVAKGSLPEIECKFVGNETPKSGATIGLSLIPTEKDFATSMKKWMDENGLQEGDQLTFLAGFQPGTMIETMGIESFYHQFAISRLEFKFDASGNLIVDKDNINLGWKMQELKESGGDTVTGYAFDNEYFNLHFAAAAGGSGGSVIDFKGAGYDGKDGYIFDMMAVIHSRLDGTTWRRSFSRFGIKPLNTYWITFEEALPSYVKAVNSSKYLNMGAQKTGILGDQ